MSNTKSEAEQIEALENMCLAVQKLVQQARITTAPREVLEKAESLVKETIDVLEPHAFDGLYAQHRLNAEEDVSLGRRDSDDPADVMPYSPFIGRRNPVSPRFKLHVDKPGETASGKATFPPSFTGPPGCVHGGIIAGVFDELLSVPNWTGGPGGFTGTLSVRYEKPTPLLTPLSLHAERVGREGRKIMVRGDIRHQGEVTASAEAIFVRPRGRQLI